MPADTPHYLPVRPDWLARVQEPILEPALPIIDAHHHLWDRPGFRYMVDDLLADCATGHNIVATLFMQCQVMYRADGPAAMKPVGEVEFVNGMAAIGAARQYGPTQICAAIIGHANLSLGAAVRAVLEAEIQAGNGRFRGIRHLSAWDADASLLNPRSAPLPDLMMTAAFREGFAALAPLGLSYDAFVFHPQLPEVLDLARSFPQTRIILNHVGTPVGAGRHAGRRDAIFPGWQRDVRAIAACPNVTVKLGGLAMRTVGFDFPDQPDPPTSEQAAAAWRPYIETCIEAFGPARCMFESNFPVDKGGVSYPVCWNAFKRLASGASATEKAALFSGTAARVYNVPL